MFSKDLKGVKEKLCNTTEKETMKRIRESRANWFRSQIGLVSTGQEGFFFFRGVEVLVGVLKVLTACRRIKKPSHTAPVQKAAV